MTEITIDLRKSTHQGRLYPRYDEEADLLEVGSQVVRPWPMGINVDGRVILDADAERVLANFDLLIPRRYWKLGAKPSLSPQPKEADLLLSEPSLKHKNFSLPLTVTSNATKSWAYLAFGPRFGDNIWVKLSPQCFAELSGDALVGFYVLL